MKIYRYGREYIQSYTLFGMELEVQISGGFSPATRDEPASYPDIEILKASVDDQYEFVESYLDGFFEEEFSQAALEAIKEQTTAFGVQPTQVELNFNGITCILRVPPDPSQFEVLHASVDDPTKFADALPDKMVERIRDEVWSQRQDI
jgi:hypothetical protein